MTAVLRALARTRAPRVAQFSRFEFWPAGLFYAPVVAQWIWLGLRHGDMTLPTAANPRIETGGLCGESKSSILDTLAPDAAALVAPYAMVTTGADEMAAALPVAERLGWPVVLKPDVGCNGAGVRLIHDEAMLEQALAAFPRGVRVMLQRYVADPGEAGIFYIRHPDAAVGRITSLTLKAIPAVVGNGRSTLHALVMAHPRAGAVPQVYLPRLGDRLHDVPAAGEVVPLVFTGNHCKGAVFENGADAITPALSRAVEAFARGIPDFHFGRIDVRYSSEAALRAGQGFTVIEVNGAGSEATHIWDARCTLREAYASQFAHHGMAWEIGRIMRARGHRTSGLRAMYRSWRKQLRLMASYPLSD